MEDQKRVAMVRRDVEYPFGKSVIDALIIETLDENDKWIFDMSMAMSDSVQFPDGGKNFVHADFLFELQKLSELGYEIKFELY